MTFRRSIKIKVFENIKKIETRRKLIKNCLVEHLVCDFILRVPTVGKQCQLNLDKRRL